MSPLTTLTGIESSPSQMVRDGLPNINLDYGKLGNDYARQFGIWLFVGGLCLCFAVIILGLIGGVIT